MMHITKKFIFLKHPLVTCQQNQINRALLHEVSLSPSTYTIQSDNQVTQQNSE